MYSFGTDEYITRVVNNYSRSLLAVAYAILKSTSDAQDAVQETFLRLVSKRPQFNDCNHEKAWLIRVTVNISRNMLKASSRKNLPLEDYMHTESRAEDDLLAVVLSLPEKYRTVIHLYYYEDYSIAQIASILNRPPATIGTWLSRARNMLRTMLKGE